MTDNRPEAVLYSVYFKWCLFLYCGYSHLTVQNVKFRQVLLLAERRWGSHILRLPSALAILSIPWLDILFIESFIPLLSIT